MTFEQARKQNAGDVYCTADIDIHEQLYLLEISEDNFWSYNWDQDEVTNPELDKAIYEGIKKMYDIRRS